MQNPQRKVVGYARVSTARQTREKTIETQVEMIQSYCDAQGLQLVAIHRDEGVSGTMPFDQRPGGKQVMHDIEVNDVEAIVVYRTDRLWRSASVQAWITEEVYNRLEVDLVSITDPIDLSSASGEMLSTITGAMASYERKTFLQRSQDATERLVREGIWMGGIVPYGYRAVGERKSCRLAIDDETMSCGYSPKQVIEMVFDLCANQKWSSGRIAEHLNAQGVLPHYARDERKHKRPSGVRRELTRGVWRDARIQCIIHNTIYKGVHHWGRRTKKPSRPSRRERKRETISRTMPAIVSTELWEAAQQTLTNNRSLARRNLKRQYLLRGKMKCVHCGLTLVGTVSNAAKIAALQERGELLAQDADVRDGYLLRGYYICTGKNNARSLNAKPCQRCNSMSLRADRIEAMLWADVEEFLRNPQDTLVELEQHLTQGVPVSSPLGNRDALEARLAQLDKERATAIGLLTRGIITEADLRVQLQKNADAVATINNQLTQQIVLEKEREKQLALIPTATSLMAQIKARLDAGLDFETRSQIISLLLADVQVETTIIPPPLGKVKPKKRATVTAIYRFWPASDSGATLGTTTELPHGVRADTCSAE